MPNAVSAKRLVIGVDVGGTKVAAGFVDFSLIRCRKQEIAGDFDQFSLAVLTARLGFRASVEGYASKGFAKSQVTKWTWERLPWKLAMKQSLS